MYKTKNDIYKTNRGGVSHILDIHCEGCDAHICYYQKDGPGGLRRMYLDRMIDLTPNEEQLQCANCDRILAMKIIYQKEGRVAYRLFVESVTKKVVRAADLEAAVATKRQGE